MPLSLTRLARALTNRLKPACLVLCYHRVSNDTSDHWGNAVSASDFEGHVRFLAQRYAIVSIEELVQSVERGAAARFRTVAITFDDGYAVNLRSACEILLQHHAAATFYVNTAWLDGSLFWWDDLALALAGAQSGRGERAPLDWLSREVDLSPESPRRSSEAFEGVRSALKVMPDVDRRGLLQRFRVEFGVSDGTPPEHAPMTAADITTLAAEPSFTVAAHTHSHPSLAGLPHDRQRAEVLENRRILEEITGKTVTHFSYPFGAARDFSDATVAVVRSARFRSAATTEGGPVRWPADPFRIPRLSVKNWDVRRFEAHVRDAWAR